MKASYPSLGRARYAQLVLALVGLFGAMDLQVVGLLTEPIKRELGLSDVQVGLAYGTAYFAAYGLLAVPAGMVVDRVSRTRLLLAAMLLSCGGLALSALSHTLAMLVLSKVVTGVASAVVYPAAMSLLSDFFAPDKRAFGTLSYPIGQTLGQVGALLIGGLGYSALVKAVAADPQLLGALAPWRMVSLVFAAIGILIVPLIFVMREPARMETGNAGKGSFRELWEYRRFLVPVFAALMCVSGVMASIATWFAPALMRLYKLQPGDFAAASSLITIVTSLLAFIATGKLVNLARARGGNRALMLPAAALAALCIPCTLMGLMPSAAGFAVLCALYLLFNGITLAVPIIAINFQIPNELRGLCMGAYVILIAIAGMTCAPVVGYVGRRLGGDHMIGQGIALVSVPLQIAATLSFWIASRSNSTNTESALQ